MPFLILAVVASISCSCSQRNQRQEASLHQDARASALHSETHQDFFDNLARLCGTSFAGKQVYRSHHGSSWAHLDLTMHVSRCRPDSIFIPFRVGDDTSRTWLFVVEEGRLRFRHDHRHEDGTPEDESLYGGYANGNGTAFVQYFPADDFTANLIDGGGGNLWTVSISEDFSAFSYRLDRDGEKRFQIDFDLSQPL